MGPLAGLRVVEFAGIGPGPMAAMLLADMGATVIRLDRTVASDLGVAKPTRFDLLMRGRRSIAIDLKRPAGIHLALELLERADASIEGFRPGTMERLGLGPHVALTHNPRLVYGRMTGWGQEGPLAQAAGHDLNYIALTGALAAIGNAGEAPVAPLNLVGDFGGGALYLAFGMVCALLEAKHSGKGQVVDAAMTDGASSLMTMFFGLHAAGLYSLDRGTNILDGGSAIYGVYACADGLYVSVAAIEMKFRADLFRLLGIEPGRTGVARQDRCGIQDQDPGCVVQGARRQRRLLRPGADHGGGARASAQQAAPDLCRDRRRAAAGAGAALRANQARTADAAGRAGRRHPRCAARLGIFRSRDCDTCRGKSDHAAAGIREPNAASPLRHGRACPSDISDSRSCNGRSPV